MAHKGTDIITSVQGAPMHASYHKSGQHRISNPRAEEAAWSENTFPVDQLPGAQQLLLLVFRNERCWFDGVGAFKKLRRQGTDEVTELNVADMRANWGYKIIIGVVGTGGLPELERFAKAETQGDFELERRFLYPHLTPSPFVLVLRYATEALSEAGTKSGFGYSSVRSTVQNGQYFSFLSANGAFAGGPRR